MKLIDRYSLKYVTFPVFQIPDEVRLEDGLLLYNNKVIDDLNQPASTLGTRRLQTPHAKYRMRKLFRNLIDLIKNNYTGKLIDSKGLVFKYRKNSFEKVVSHKIKSIVKSDGLCTMTLIGVNFPIRLNAPPLIVLLSQSK